VSFAYGVVGSQHAAMKARNKTIAGLRGEVYKLITERQLRDEELSQLWPLRQHDGELDWL